MIETNRSILHAIYTTDNSLPRRAAMTHTHTHTHCHAGQQLNYLLTYRGP